MSQRVPSCDMDHETPNITSKASPPLLHRHRHHHHPPSNAPHASTDYEVAELTWENGNVAMHGHGHARITKPIAKYPTSGTAGSGVAWDKQHQNGTLESIVDQATGTQLQALSPATPSFISWLGGAQYPHVATAVDALVPCSNSFGHHAQETSDPVPNLPSVAGSSGDGRGKGRKRARGGEGGWACASQGSAAPTVVTLDDTCELYGGEDVGFTTTSSPDGEAEDRGGSPDTENTSFGGHDSFSHSKRSQKRDAVADEEGDKANKRALGVSSLSTKRSRAAAIHNQSERKRRDRINEKMRTLQKLVPNSSKTDKASMLDEVIDHLKQLQAQVQMMSRMSSIPQMMMPMTMPHLQMSMMANMAHMAQMAQMGLGLGMMDMTNLTRTAPAGIPPLLHPSAFTALSGGSWEPSSDRMQPPGGPVPSDPFSAFMAHSTQSVNMDVYSKMAALYQQLYQQQQQPPPKSST
ncbi:hypothetical protein J5N97_018482 [Dioscorea zingiberensis]|uniref:BHLH domain-containing protein n=1 Tax=Dioscorea zingiberensis TaxID=325984 RepID=A0A9D5CCX8_9LILI|nr:hypothetical protein J5N97_018482 [Dioscorea zingiberensis]